MNSVLTTPRRLPEHPPQLSSAARPVRRVGLLDRLALRAGLALLVWARRPRAERLASAGRLSQARRAERYRTPAEMAELNRHRDLAYRDSAWHTMSQTR